MQIRIRSTGKIVQDYGFRMAFPETSFPSVLTETLLNDFGADFVHQGAIPEHTRYKTIVNDGVEQINGKWYTKYVLGPIFTDNEEATAAEQEAAYKAQKDAEQAKSVRATRDAKLSETDWTQVVDSPFDQAKMMELQAYRQALRDVTAQAGFPWTVEWPAKPE